MPKEKEPEGVAVFAPQPSRIGAVGMAIMDTLAEDAQKIIDVQSGANLLEVEEYLNNRQAVKAGESGVCDRCAFVRTSYGRVRLALRSLHKHRPLSLRPIVPRRHPQGQAEANGHGAPERRLPHGAGILSARGPVGLFEAMRPSPRQHASVQGTRLRLCAGLGPARPRSRVRVVAAAGWCRCSSSYPCVQRHPDDTAHSSTPSRLSVSASAALLRPTREGERASLFITR